MNPPRLRFSAVVSFLVLSLAPAATAAGKTAGEVLSQLQAQGGAREAQLITAAKREGKVVLYGTTNAAVMQELLDRFKRKYPFLEVANYRATT